MPPLRERYGETERLLQEAADEDAPVILAECDLLVDGLNTISDLLGVRAAGRA